ncbi:MAG: exodeoxyribonuclease VII small subunit [Ignavibacteriaceae bacterium]|nr:exodeoxyribonuclease VII small subunit [Ignavibacteriaceae bacterium]
MKQKTPDLKFIDKVKRLEDISQELDNEEIDLEKAIDLYEEGVKLSQDCLSTLQNAELKITELRGKLAADFNQTD